MMHSGYFIRNQIMYEITNAVVVNQGFQMHSAVPTLDAILGNIKG